VVATTNLLTVLPGIALPSALAANRIKARRLRNPAIIRSVTSVTNPRRDVHLCPPNVFQHLKTLRTEWRTKISTVSLASIMNRFRVQDKEQLAREC
jgi:hypothetical protein